jgi:hypothetical protein
MKSIMNDLAQWRRKITKISEAIWGNINAVGGRRSAVGGRRSAVGGRRSAVGRSLASLRMTASTRKIKGRRGMQKYCQ